MRNDLTQERVKILLTYDPETGIFVWNADGINQVKAGRIAGTPHEGYVRICVDANRYTAHRLAWLYQTGAWPANVIDHINGRRNDNTWTNLRDVFQRENLENQYYASHCKKTPGGLGVFPVSKSKSFRAQIRIRGRLKHIGTFKTPELASAAYWAEKRIHHISQALRTD